jgi:hypothetical protein
MGLLLWQILGIVRFQIEIKNILSLVCMFIIFFQCKVQIENLERLIFVNKN